MSIPANAALPQSGSLVSRWKLDEFSSGSGAVSRADSVGSNTLTDNNTVASSTGYANGTSGVDFINGANLQSANTEFLSISDGSQSGLDLSSSFTAALWLKRATSTGDFQNIINKWKESTNNRAYRIRYHNSDFFEFNVSANGSAAGTTLQSGSNPIPTGTFVHCVFVFTASTKMEIYLNGVSNASSTTSISASVFNSAETFALGKEPENGQYYNGMMQDAIIWSTALSASDVTSLYNLYTTAGTATTGDTGYSFLM